MVTSFTCTAQYGEVWILLCVIFRLGGYSWFWFWYNGIPWRQECQPFSFDKLYRPYNLVGECIVGINNWEASKWMAQWWKYDRIWLILTNHSIFFFPRLNFLNRQKMVINRSLVINYQLGWFWGYCSFKWWYTNWRSKSLAEMYHKGLYCFSHLYMVPKACWILQLSNNELRSSDQVFIEAVR